MFGATADLPVSSIEGVFEAVARGQAERGVVPIENSTEGAVTFTADALLDGELLIQREIILEVGHALIGEGEDLSRLRRVHSHPQALAQCGTLKPEPLRCDLSVPTLCVTSSAASSVSHRATAVVGALLIQGAPWPRSKNRTT